jgi:hypothetical protein
MASFVRETGTTSLAQTNDAAMHSRATNPMPTRSVGSGSVASKVVVVGDDDDNKSTLSMVDVTSDAIWLSANKTVAYVNADIEIDVVVATGTPGAHLAVAGRNAATADAGGRCKNNANDGRQAG